MKMSEFREEVSEESSSSNSEPKRVFPDSVFAVKRIQGNKELHLYIFSTSISTKGTKASIPTTSKRSSPLSVSTKRGRTRATWKSTSVSHVLTEAITV
jgi:hypothetical protein